MRVRALRLGYYNHVRVKPGTVFEMHENDFSPKDDKGKPLLYVNGPETGKPVTCRWVELAGAAKPGRGRRGVEEADETTDSNQDVI